MRWMGEFLSQKGYTVLGIRLAGHATIPEDLIHTCWQEWLLSVEDGYNLLHSCTDQIFLVGLSLGGMLGLIFASPLLHSSPQEQRRIGGVIAMSTPYSSPGDWRLKFTRILSIIRPYIHKGKPGSGWFGDAWKQHIAYPGYPLRGIGEIRKSMDVLHTAAPQVTVPVLLIYTHNDHPLIFESMVKIHACLVSTEKQMLRLDGSGHTITEEPKRQLVFEASADFIQQYSKDQGV
jgi:carboxylesterase